VSKDFDILRCHNALRAETRSGSARERKAGKKKVIVTTKKMQKAELKPRQKRCRPAKIKRQENQG
jgi:hypothetical protein